MDAVTLARSFRRMTARAIDAGDSTFRTLFADEDESAPGATIAALQTLHEFIDEYSREIDLDAIHGSRLDKIASWAGLARLVAEPDSSLRSRFKTLFLRGELQPWGTVASLRASLQDIYPDGESFVVPSWARIDLVRNGEFDSLDGWTIAGEASYLQNLEDRMNGASVVVDTTSGSKKFSQEIQCSSGRHSALCIFSRTPALQGAVALKVAIGESVLAETIAYTTGSRLNGAGIAELSFILNTPATVRVEVATVPGYSCVIDTVRMGKIEYPSMLVCVFNEFETFYDGTLTYNGRIVSNGYIGPWRNVGLDDLVNSLRPAGVFVEIMTRPFIQIA